MEVSINSISYCALDCNACIIRSGRLAYKAKCMINQMKRKEFKTLARGLTHYRPELFSDLVYCEQGLKALKAIENLDCKTSCKSGGGSTNCEIRKCCISHKYDGCWECDDFENCSTLGFLKPMHGEANIKNIQYIRQKGMWEFLISDVKKWYCDKSEEDKHKTDKIAPRKKRAKNSA